jgi:hypothetical protein
VSEESVSPAPPPPPQPQQPDDDDDDDEQASRATLLSPQRVLRLMPAAAAAQVSVHISPHFSAATFSTWREKGSAVHAESWQWNETCG